MVNTNNTEEIARLITNIQVDADFLENYFHRLNCPMLHGEIRNIKRQLKSIMVSLESGILK